MVSCPTHRTSYSRTAYDRYMSTSTLTAEYVRLLACPVCRHPLGLESDALRCTGCHRRYPIVDGIPMLLADRAS